MSEVPFVDLSRQHEPLLGDLRAAFERVLQSNAYILGDEVKKFEEAFKIYTGAKHAIGCANGTDALVLILLALGIGPGDEVITVSHTFFATVEAICSSGAKPVLVDVRKEDGLIDPSLVEAAIKKRTKAILPVHLYGHPVDLDPLVQIAQKHGLAIFEDAAQAHGSKYKGKSPGMLTTAASYSFFPGKNLGALGDAGAIVTNDDKLAERIKSLRDHGRSEKYSHNDFGWNMRMDGLQGAFLAAKLPHLDRWTEVRRKIAKIYRAELNDLPGLRLLEESPHVEHSNHLFVVCHEQRETLGRLLKSEGIGSGVHYPIPCHLQTAWKKQYEELSLPNSELVARTCLSLPMFGAMEEEEAHRVVKALRKVVPGLAS